MENVTKMTEHAVNREETRHLEKGAKELMAKLFGTGFCPKKRGTYTFADEATRSIICFEGNSQGKTKVITCLRREQSAGAFKAHKEDILVALTATGELLCGKKAKATGLVA